MYAIIHRHVKIYKNKKHVIFMFDSFFESLGWENLLLICIFLIFLGVLSFPLKRTFGKGTGGMLSLVIALLITGGLYFSGFDVQGLFFNIGVGDDIITTFVPLILIGALIYLLLKFKSKFFLIAGIISILIALFKLFYETTIMWIIGIVCLLIGLLLWWKGKKKEKIKPPKDDDKPDNDRKPDPKIIYKKRERSAYDLQQKYGDYKFTIFRSNLNPDKRKQMLKAMYIIEGYLKKLGTSPKGQSPREIEKTLKERGLI